MPVFTTNLPKILAKGDQVEIVGKIKDIAAKFSINLCEQSGEEPSDVVLHFDVRLQRDNIISLSRKNGVWIGSGNYDTNYNMFEPGSSFRIIFEMKEVDVITIYCNGKFHSNFLPKIPLDMAKYVVVWGDVEKVSDCYFYLGEIRNGSENPDVVQKESPRLSKTRHPVVLTSTMLPEGTRRCFSIRKKHEDSVGPEASYDENDDSGMSLDGERKYQRETEKYVYQSLLCQPEQLAHNRRKIFNVARMQHKSKSPVNKRENLTDMQKIDSETEIDTKNSDVSFDHKTGRKAKFPFNHVISFIGKTLHKWEDLKKKISAEEDYS